MADLGLYKVDLTTEQPGGRRGESPRAAFTKYNDLIDTLRGVVEHVGASAPTNPVAYMQWLDTGVNPAMIRRRNAANTAWVAITPALQAFGSAAFLDVPEGQTAFGSASAAAVESLLTKAGNLTDLSNPAQARLNLGVIQTLAGEVFNTDNCTVTTNSNGTSYRFPNGLQICEHVSIVTLDVTLGDGVLFRTAAGVLWTFPQAFLNRAFAIAEVDSFETSEARIWFPTVSTGSVSVTQRAVGTLSRTHTNVAVRFFAIGRWK